MSRIDDMKIEELGEKERALLLTALDFDIKNLTCHYCKKKVDYKDCSILPPIQPHHKAIITCDSPLCLTEYFEDLEEDTLEINEETKQKLMERIKNLKEGKVMSFDELLKKLTQNRGKEVRWQIYQ